MRNEILLKSTTSRKLFNRAYKLHLEQRGKIHCSLCGYNRGENDERKWYGYYDYDDMNICRGKKGTHTRYPNWKLVSKNRKQWMKKPIRIVEDKHHYVSSKVVYVKFKF